MWAPYSDPTSRHFGGSPAPSSHTHSTTDDTDDGLDPTIPMPPPKKLPPVVLAIDIGGTKFAAGLISPAGELVDRSVVLVNHDVGPEAHFTKLTSIIDQQLDAADRHGVRVAAVGIGSAGPITRNCETVSPVNIPAWRGFPLRQRVREHTGARVYGDLDGKALALAEGWLGAAVGVPNYCVLTVSTGIGAGIVLDGELLDGFSGNAGHVGHTLIDPNGRRCGCGARGCLEAEASGLAIEAITGRSPTEPTYEIMQRTGRLVGRGVASLCNFIDLDLVVVGRRRGPRVRGHLLQRRPGGAEHARSPGLQPPGPHHPDPSGRPRVRCWAPARSRCAGCPDHAGIVRSGTALVSNLAP